MRKMSLRNREKKNST